jgi:perosamine synthetase
MTNLQASLGLAQFERIEDFLKRRKEIFSCYKNYLKPLKNLKLNFEAKWAQNVYWMICLEFDDFTEQDRDELMISLRQNNIDSRPFFYPLSEMPMYDKAHTPIAHKIYKKGINLPTYYDLKEEQIHYICEKVKELM